MRLLKVWDSEYPWDVRAEKVAKTLTQRGHEVHMVARNRDGRPTVEALEECTVHRLSPWTRAGRRIDAASQFPAFFNPRWTGHMLRVGEQVGADLILVRDLPLALAAVEVGRTLSVPVVLDMAENYPAMMRDLWTTKATRFGDFLVRNPALVALVESRALRLVDHVLVVVEESRARLLELGVSEDRVSIVGNTPDLGRVEEFRKIRAVSASAGRSGNGAQRPFHLTYLGLMEEARGVRLAIEAVAALRSRGIPVQLDLIGDGRALPSFRELASRLGLTDAVLFHGFVPYREALGIVARADAGLIPHHANESWETTIPNKLFDYMSLAIPVIASDVTPVARILSVTGGGVTFRDRDPGDLAAVVEKVRSRTDRSEIGEAGLRAVMNHYHWEKDADRLEGALLRVVEGAMN